MLDLLLLDQKEMFKSYLNHPFVDGIGAGTLSKDRFKHYLLQDYLYLLEYSKVFAMGIVKSPNEAAMRGFSKYLNEILNSEMGIHIDYLKDFKINPKNISKLYKCDFTTFSYTSYMYSVSCFGSFSHVVVALLACALSYEFIAKELLAKYPKQESFYSPWIKAYASDEYNQINVWLRELCKENLEEKDLASYKEIFKNCCLFEYKFWQNSWDLGKA